MTIARGQHLSSDAPDPSGTPPVRIEHAAGDRLELAAQRLVSASANGDGDAGRRFISAATAQRIDLTHFYVTLHPDGETVSESVLIVPGAGRTGMVFTSQPAGAAAERELAALIQHATRSLDGATLAQALLLPSESAVATALAAGGFTKLADLAYLRRRADLRKATPPPAPLADAVGAPHVEWTPERAAPGSAPIRLDRVAALDLPEAEIDRRLVAGLVASYEDTLDCPRLCELRDPADVLTSHKAVGSYDPELWWLISRADRPLGAMLWSPMGPDPARGGDSAELVYVGIAPSLRGLGLGTALLLYGLTELATRRIRETTCAVDLGNDPACAMYNRYGFRRFAERSAWVMPIGT
jgi:ribosomal protein S18 acetylase RimI-like enzyme